MPVMSDMAGSLRPRRVALRAAFAFALATAPAGATPFAALWLKAHGAPLDSLGLLLAFPLIGRIIAARPLAAWARKFSEPWKPVSLLCGVTSAVAMLATRHWDCWFYILAWWVVCLASGACFPLMDAGLVASKRGVLAYAKSGGAIAGAAASIGVGALFALLGASGVMIWTAATALAAALTIPTLMRSLKSRARECPLKVESPHPETGVRDQSCLILALAAAALIEASHGFNSIAMVAWTARGFGKGLCGLLWAAGIFADIAFLWALGRAGDRIAPNRLLILGGAAAMARWAGFATAPPLLGMFVLQVLHALSFTASYLASVKLIGMLGKDARGLSTQTLNWALSTGLCAGVSMLFAGPLYAALNVRGYWVMCAMAGVGLGFALALDLKLRGLSGWRVVAYYFMPPKEPSGRVCVAKPINLRLPYWKIDNKCFGGG